MSHSNNMASINGDRDYRAVTCLVIGLLLAILIPVFYLTADSLSRHPVTSAKLASDR